jgi:DNA-binding LacI/PurR family transcriptional regulator
VEVLGSRERPTAIFASNDLMAFGAIHATRSLGWRVPQDISVVGFDNIPLSSYFTPPLTTVEIPMYGVGTASMQMLADLLSHKEFSRIRLCETRLLVRESSGKRDGGEKTA